MNPIHKPKIAILSLRNTYQYGGVLTSLKTVYDFCEKYFEPTVFFLSFDPEISTSLKQFKFTSTTKPLTYFGMRCIEVGARWAFWEPGHYSFSLHSWRKVLKNYNYFFAVSGTCIAAHPLVLLQKKFGLLLSTPYAHDRAVRVKELHGFRKYIDSLASRSMNKIEKNILEQAHFIWALSNYSIKTFENILQHPKPTMIRCGHPLDCSKMPALTHKKDKIIIAVGRFSDPRKNVSMLLRAFDLVYKTMPNTRLYVIGKKPEQNALQEFSELDSYNNVIFTGQVTGTDRDLLYQQASLMLITSHQEGFGIAGLEALQNGIPVISTKCGGPEDYVHDNCTGFQVPVNDHNLMAEKALTILSNETLHAQFAYNAQQLVINEYALEKIHTHLQMGLISIYPELQNWFIKNNAKNTL